jgi:hypothetical protein
VIVAGCAGRNGRRRIASTRPTFRLNSGEKDSPGL